MHTYLNVGKNVNKPYFKKTVQFSFKSKPNFNHWLNEVNLLCNSLKLVKNQKALKLISLLDMFKLI